MPKTRPQDSPQSQMAKFEQLARELEADESEEAFDEKLKRIVKTPPKVGAADTE